MAAYAKDISTVIKLIELMREVDNEMPMQMAHCFLCVAIRPGLTMQNLAEMTALSQSSTSRNVQTLGKWHRIGKPGYDLVEAVEDPNDTRRKIMYLTPKGRQLASKIIGEVRHEKAVDFESPTSKEALAPIFKARMSRA